VVGVNTYEFSYSGLLNQGDLPSNYAIDLHNKIKKEDKLKKDNVKAGVVYKASAYVELSGSHLKKDTIKTKAHFIISPQVKDEDHLKGEPVKESGEKGFALSRGKLKMTAELDSSIFCPGDSFKIKVNIANESGKNVDAVKIKLMRDLKISAGAFYDNYNDEVHRMVFEGVKSKETKNLTLEFEIPSDVPPTTHSKFISNDYHLDIECDVPWAGDLEVHPKIVLALLPPAPKRYDTIYKKKWFKLDK